MDLKNFQEAYNFFSYCSLDSTDTETWLSEPTEGCIQMSASLHSTLLLSAICMSVHMAECVCALTV